MADNEFPVVYIAVYRGSEDGDDIPNDPFLKKAEPIEAGIYTTVAMAQAKCELELRRYQKIIRNWNIEHADHRIEVDNDEGKIFRVKDERSEITGDLGVATGVSITMSPEGVDMVTNCESYKDIPFYFAREMVFYNGV